jgi:hypothetical protein
MKNATPRSANARQRLIWGEWDVIGPPVIWLGEDSYEDVRRRLGG